MKPAPFRYERPRSLEEALEQLATAGDEGRVRAGGQSLVPMMNLRLARPKLLVDLNSVPGLAGITGDADGLRVGAMVRHSAIERHPGWLGGFEVLRSAARFIGHYGIRDRGTIGGSLAHADATAEWPLMALLLDAVVEVRDRNSQREIPAKDFLLGPFTTALEPQEILVGVRFPRAFPRAAIDEFSPRHGDFAIVAAGVALDLDVTRVRHVRIALGGVESAPVRSPEAEAILQGELLSDEAVLEAASAAARSVDPPHDAAATSAQRRLLVETLVTRTLRAAAGRTAQEAAV
jgi:aerobic carbon-monoxide dehydrogenase medium subunit